jgi:hypothetical protein
MREAAAAAAVEADVGVVEGVAALNSVMIFSHDIIGGYRMTLDYY